MKHSRNATALRAGVAASLFVHITFASIVHANRVQAEQQEAPTPAIVVHLTTPKPRPTPTPPPPPRRPARIPHRNTSLRMSRPKMNVVAQHAPARHDTWSAVNTAQTIGDSAPPPETPAGPGAAAQGPAPTPVPTPKPACSAPDVPAKAVDPVTPDEPEAARDQGFTGTAKIRVDLDQTGRVVDASVYSSTGSPQLDGAALQAARESRYSPQETDCKDVPGSYLFTVQFQ